MIKVESNIIDGKEYLPTQMGIDFIVTNRWPNGRSGALDYLVNDVAKVKGFTHYQDLGQRSTGDGNFPYRHDILGYKVDVI